MIIDSNETPGGLASTDVTPEGFVSLPASNCQNYVLTIFFGLALRCWWPCHLLSLQILR
jgi:hypothetical protein